MPAGIPKAFPGFCHQWVGNGKLFKFLAPYEEKYPQLQGFNSVYNLAPSSKWGLSIVPMYGVFVGSPPVEKIDISTSSALTCTGVVWSFYALIITPQNAGSRALATVNMAMASVNGYNCYRYYSATTKKE
jgi:hypothetical protein